MADERQQNGYKSSVSTHTPHKRYVRERIRERIYACRGGVFEEGFAPVKDACNKPNVIAKQAENACFKRAKLIVSAGRGR